ncbi:MAG: hypothetical protein MUC68_10550 [Burkholderiaceae bacterium]|jgi:hypothetical protein|nr:hypothetical protein [Burkholderiaceae bacterium]
MAAQGNYASVPRSAGATISTANANRDGTGTLGTVMTGPARNLGADPPLAGGSRIDGLTIAARGPTTAGAVRLFVHDGAAARFIGEVIVPPRVPSASLAAWSVALNRDNCSFLPIILAAGASLRASTERAEAFDVQVVSGGDF